MADSLARRYYDANSFYCLKNGSQVLRGYTNCFKKNLVSDLFSYFVVKRLR